MLVLAIPILGNAGQETRDAARPVSSLSARIQSLPLDAAHRGSLAEAVKARNYKLAERILLDETERHPQSQPMYTLLGDILFLDGDYLNSAIAMKRADVLYPLDEHGRFTLAMAYITLDKRDWARLELRQLAKSDPRNALYPYWLSRLDYRDMQLTSAVAHAQKAINLNPTFMKAYDNLGLYYDALGKSEDAIQAYKEAVRLNRERRLRSPWPSMNLGTVLLKLGRPDEAEVYLRESLEEDPRFPKAHFQYGLLLEKRGKYAEAIQELQRAAEFDPTYPEPCFVLGRIYRRLGDEKSMQEAFKSFQARSQKEKDKNLR
jgi:tetratricopeptide (TPR) repeat protein